MTRIFIAFFVFMFSQTVAQTKIELIRALNSAIENKAEIFTFMEKTGYLEQYQGSILYRFKLSEIVTITEKEVEHNFIVTVSCRHVSCFSVIKGDSSTSAMDNNSYFFSNTNRSTQFAKSLQKLSQLYQPGETIELSLIHNESEAPSASSPRVTPSEKDGLDNYLEEQNGKETKKIADDNEDEDTEKKSKPIPPSKPSKPVVKEMDDQDDDEKPSVSKQKTRVVKDENDEDEEKLPAKRVTREVKSTHDNKDKEIGGLSKDDNEGEDKGKDEKNSVFCKQIHQLIQSGLSTQFKNIEGTETNTKTKINESKLKLKGAKRSYLSWYKKQRAFIAEIKTSKDFDLLQIEYDELQTRLENCLGGDWDFTDKSQMMNTPTLTVKFAIQNIN